VLASPRVSESLGEPEINDVHEVLLLANAKQKVIGFDVAMEEVP